MISNSLRQLFHGCESASPFMPSSWLRYYAWAAGMMVFMLFKQGLVIEFSHSYRRMNENICNGALTWTPWPYPSQCKVDNTIPAGADNLLMLRHMNGDII
jgi:hypothetical protein